MKSKIYSSDYVKTTTKGQLWIPAFLTIGFLMVFPVAELLTLGNWFGMNYESSQIEQLYEKLWKDGFMSSGLVMIAVAALINGINNFWYLYSSKKVDFYHCLPIRRSQLFWHRTFVGILYYLIPYLVMEFMSVCIGAMRGFFNLKLMKLAVAMLVLHLIMYLLLYFSVVLVVCMTGNLLMGALCLAAVFTYGPVLGQLLHMYQYTFFSTAFRMNYGAVKVLKEQGSPFFLCRSFLERYLNDNYGTSLAAVVILTILAGTAAYFAYVKRPSESTGKSMIYRWSEPIIRLMVVIPCGLGAGLIFYMMPSGKSQMIWWIFGMLVGTVLVHGIVEVVFKLDFRKFFAHRLQLMLSLCAVAVCALIVKQDLLGYNTYLPAYDKLEGIGVSTVGIPFSDNYSYVQPNGDGTYEIGDNTWAYSMPDREETNAGLSKGIYRALETIITGQEANEEDTYQIPVKYVMKSGKVVYRQYNVTWEEAQMLFKACYEEGTLKKRKFSFLQVEDKYLQWVRGCFCNGENYVLFQDDRDKVTALLDALAKDVEEADADTLLGNPCATLSFQYENVPVKQDPERAALMAPGLQYTGYVYGDVEIFPEYKRTLAILEETGYPLSMEDVDLEYIEFVYYVEDQYGNRLEGQRDKYEDKKNLDALRKCINCWNRETRNLSVNMKTKEGREEIYVGLIEDKIPEFIRKNIERAENGDMQIGGTDAETDEPLAESADNNGGM